MALLTRLLLLCVLLAATLPQGCDFQTTPKSPVNLKWLQALSDNVTAIATRFHQRQGNKEDNLNAAKDVANDPIIQQAFIQLNYENHQTDKGFSALTFAVTVGNVAFVKVLLGVGALVDIRDENGSTPLITAIRRNHSEMVKVLLEAGADPNVKIWRSGSYAIHHAVLTGNLVIVEDLINAGANIDQVNGLGDTPLMLTTITQQLETSRFLLNRGASVNIQNIAGKTALIMAAQKDNLDLLRAVIQAGAHLNAKNKKGETALMYATVLGKLELMRELLSVGAEIEITTENGHTPLHLCIIYERPEAAKILLAYGADINRRAIDGGTVLMNAVNRGQEVMVEVLLQHCPDMSIENINRKTVFTIARERGDKNIKSMIEAHASTTCNTNGLAYILGSIKYDSCRQQQCCHGNWRNTGLASASCGTQCNTPGTRLGTCVLVNECVRLEQVFRVTNAAGDVTRITKFLVDHRCDTREGNIYVCCPKA